MTEEEIAAKAAADAKAKEEANKGAAEITPVEEVDLVALKDEEIAKLREERDNYKEVALKRLGKLPADSEFLGESGKDINSLIEDKVKEALVNKEINSKEREKEDLYKKTLRENSELKLALKNRPGGSIGGESGAGVEVKDNVFSPEQIMALKAKATRLHADPEKFVENAKKNLLNRK